MKNILLILVVVLLFSCKNEKVKPKKNIFTEKDTIEEVFDSTFSDYPEPIIVYEDDFCQDVIIDIIQSSKEHQEETEGLYEAVVANGGTSYGYMLEDCPIPKQDYIGKSEYFEYNVHESYPDRMAVISRYRFHPIKLILQKWNPGENTYYTIKFDKSLLKRFKKDCKGEY